MTNDRSGQAAEAARRAAERERKSGASRPPGRNAGPDEVRAPEEEEPQPPVRGGEIRDPDPEEAPELLGERSDYPLAPPEEEP